MSLFGYVALAEHFAKTSPGQTGDWDEAQLRQALVLFGGLPSAIVINENIGLFELAASNPGFVNALQRVSTLTRRSPASLLASAIGVSAAVALLQPRPDEPAPPLTGIRRGVGSNGGNDPNGSKDPKGPDNDPKPPIVPIIPPLGDEGIQKPALDLPANPVLPPPGQERQSGTNANGDAIFIDSFGSTYIRDRAGNQIATDAAGLPQITNPINLTNGRDDHIIANHIAGAGKPGKTEFPAGWDRTRIITRVSEIAADTSLPRLTDPRGTPYVVGVRDGLQIRVNFFPNNDARAGQIATAYPVNVPKNQKRN